MIEKQVLVTYHNEKNFAFNFEPIEDTLFVVKTKKGYEAKYLTIEQNPESPREWDNFGTMYCYHNNYDLGDKTDIPKLDTIKELEEYLKKEKGVVVMLPLYLLDHSGLSIRTGRFTCDAQGWDTSFVGYIYATKEDLKREKISKKKAERLLQAEVKTYNEYLTGDVYTLVKEIYNKNKKPLNYDCVGGYFGYEYANKSLKTEI